jgi:hypothetical protein
MNNQGWSKPYFALLFLAIIAIPLAVYGTASMTGLATGACSTWGIDELPAITRVCARLGRLGLAVIGAVCFLIMVATVQWRKTARATLVSAFVLLVWIGFCLVAFVAAASCLIVDISTVK